MRPYIKYPVGLLCLHVAFGVLATLGLKDCRGLGKCPATILSHSLQVLTGPYAKDSSRPIQLALEMWQMHHPRRALHQLGRSLYQSLLQSRETPKFQYPPTTLLIPRALGPIGDYYEVFELISRAFLAITIVSVSGIALHTYKEHTPEPPSRWENSGLVMATTLLTLTFYPVARAVVIGQIQVWLNALFALSFLLYILHQDALAGVLLGLMASIKPHYGLFVVWGVLRGNRALVVGMIVSTAASLIAGLITFGPYVYLDYFDWLRFLSRHGESFYPNQSVNGLVGRIVGLHDPHFNNIKWRDAYPPYSPWVRYATLLSSALLLGLCLVKGKSQHREGRYADFCLMALGVTMASPIAWEHHYGILPAIFAFLLPAVWFNAAFPRWARLLLVVCYVISGNDIVRANLLAQTYLNFLQSYLFLAAVGIFGLLLSIRGVKLPWPWLGTGQQPSAPAQT